MVDPNGRITSEAALKLFVKDSSSEAVREFLEKQELQTKPVTDSVVEWGDIGCYYVVGSDCTSSLGDDAMCYVFEDLYCISITGKLFKLYVLNVSGIDLDYENTLTLSVEPYSSNVKWYVNLNELTNGEDNPLHRYHEFFED
ncbi:hypothetical protein [Anaerocolumna xylanovorans]|uniref:Uncharacterized protein n=1 Tax=Anaerocolumna xylanovorans DSM 12503 TaxID=1121345 RepID=A0A1M7YLA7_9FIRM|nr:hypothetical protein [Anaerocolumna xylanovorans]SHO53400.1 hypothetical protein SAMN02745217_04106 [Anaerocolumna xylanovorans DSM 12503]